LWDVSDPGRPRELATLTGHTDTVFGAVFAPDGRTLVTTGADRAARLWDVSDPGRPRELATLTGHTDAVYVAVFTPDGRMLATGGNDRTVRLWDLDPGHISREICEGTNGRISPDEWKREIPSAPYRAPCL